MKPIKECVLFSQLNEWKTFQNLFKNINSTKNSLEMTKHFVLSNHELIDILNKVSSFESTIDFKMFLSMFCLKTYLNCCFGSAVNTKSKANLFHLYQKLFNREKSKLNDLFSIGLIESKLLKSIVKVVKDIYDNRKEGQNQNCLLFMLSDLNIKDSKQNTCKFKSLLQNC